ncbi:hypothetical protein [Methylobacterium sp. Gmos1]
MAPTTGRQCGRDNDLGKQPEPAPSAHPLVESSTAEACPDETDLDLAILTALLDEWNSAEDAAAFDDL